MTHFLTQQILGYLGLDGKNNIKSARIARLMVKSIICNY